MAEVDGTARSAANALLDDVLGLIDDALPERALVFGSVPPAARDLDLVVPPAANDAVAGALEGAGFSCRRGVWALFRGCAVAAVELLPPARLGLPEPEVAVAFAEARPLAGRTRLAEPAPHHVLAILARRLAHARRLEPKHRARVERAVRDDPAAWDGAGRAVGGDGAAALARLRRLVEGRRVAPRLRLRRPRPVRVLAVTAPDTDRAAFHARALADGLDRLGYDAAVVGPRATAVGAWQALVRRMRRGGVVVLVGVSPRLGPPPLRRYVLAARPLPPDSGRARHLDSSDGPEAICERIAADAWEALVRGGAVSSLLRRGGAAKAAL